MLGITKKYKKKCTFIILSLIVLYFILSPILYSEGGWFNNTKETFSERIPKIIHQTAPADKSTHPLTWTKCHESWKREFPESTYKHIMWTDEDLDILIKNDFPWFYSYYINYPKNIERIDIARYFILYKHGGIYADMDFYCNKNFFNNVEFSIIPL